MTRPGCSGCSISRRRWQAQKPRLGVIPKAARADRDRLPGGSLRSRRIGEAAVAAGNIAIPLVKALTAAVQRDRREAAGFVHWGATSQDIIDTALVLELRAAIDVAR